ncbi:MAG TPA: hypothetical protein VMK65_02500 [Longimicrobiales bacterium]|nr:hypothetical protein [Longimicrobiales bacterium]
MLEGVAPHVDGGGRRLHLDSMTAHTPYPRLLAVAIVACGCAPTATPAPAPQNPSPMVETTRRHERVPQAAPAGVRLEVRAGLGAPVRVFVPDAALDADTLRLLVHFHGAPHVAEHAVARASRPWLLAVVNLGAGSSRYERPFRDPALLEALRGAVLAGVAEALGREVRAATTVLSGFSAGCGAVRGVLSTPEGRAGVTAVLLLDGVHTGYAPPGRVLHEGGALETERLAGLLAFARAAAAGEKAMLVTHSAIFPGTYASTTETADWLLERLALERDAVLAWGPVGMQRLSEARRGRFLLYGFAGNTAPDHIDHLHGLAAFLEDLP